MANSRCANLREFRRLAGAVLLSAVGAALLGGCKGNSTAAAMVRREPVTAAPVSVPWAKGDVLHADPMSSDLWKSATIVALGAPANTEHTTLPCRAKLLVDSQHLYVAFISERADEPAGLDRDLVSLYLDNSREKDGREIVQLSAGPGGQITCNWIRAAVAAEPRPDGTPDLTHPVSMIPNWKVEGLVAAVGNGELDGKPAWTVVMAIPIDRLPLPFRTMPAMGARWKFNLMRTVMAEGDLLQANYSPVAVGAQAVSPYRMAELDIGNP